MSKCKHQTGEFEEYVDAIHTRCVADGKLDNSSLIMNNHIGNITGYLFTCWGCKRQWQYRAPNQKSLPKWLAKLHYDAFAPDEEE